MRRREENRTDFELDRRLRRFKVPIEFLRRYKQVEDVDRFSIELPWGTTRSYGKRASQLSGRRVEKRGGREKNERDGDPGEASVKTWDMKEGVDSVRKKPRKTSSVVELEINKGEGDASKLTALPNPLLSNLVSIAL